MIARTALEELALDRLFFIPAAQSPFKPSSPLAPGEARACWLRLSLAGWSKCEVDDQEIRRGGVSYTVETLGDYTRRFPGCRLFWLIGADHLAQLPRWREAAKLAELAEFVVLPRPGELVATPGEPFRVRTLDGFPMSVSASAVRARVSQGLAIDTLVPAAVAEAIHNSRLYL